MDGDAGKDATQRGDADELRAQQIDYFARCFAHLSEHVGAVVLGASRAIELALTCLFSEGHLLLEDLPGVGKTTLARVISASIDARHDRVQFTPDLLPSDVTGFSVFHPGTQEFEFREGPVFANIVIADEINRASPKVQSALLEVMEERRVTVDGATHPVPRPFMIVATQNPIELEGTYRLPEAQLDRFLIRTSMGQPSLEAEVAMVLAQGVVASETAPSGLRSDHIEALIAIAAAVRVREPVVEYAASICRATRTGPNVRMGASPRATLALVRAARVRAAADRRDFVSPDDIRSLTRPVLAHRIELHASASVHKITQDDIIDEAVRSIAPPQDRG
jgi:MoxR-like ATPase